MLSPLGRAALHGQKGGETALRGELGLNQNK